MTTFNIIISLLTIGIAIWSLILSFKVRNESNKLKSIDLQPDFILKTIANKGGTFNIKIEKSFDKKYKIKKISLVNEEEEILGQEVSNKNNISEISFSDVKKTNCYIKIIYSDFSGLKKELYSVKLELDDYKRYTRFTNTVFSFHN
ncbi:hypothetical protein [Jeotgalicoccus sp. FSL K6-3177]|uniref:hypothetical protein n=1 Tax=Jeotgalicoccus sp. FSL K6-3177 TaxID=2921494 RepID=UPI0030FD652E